MKLSQLALAKVVNCTAWRRCRYQLRNNPSSPSAERPEVQAGHVSPQLGRESGLLPQRWRPFELYSRVLDHSSGARSVCGGGRRPMLFSLWGLAPVGGVDGEAAM